MRARRGSGAIGLPLSAAPRSRAATLWTAFDRRSFLASDRRADVHLRRRPRLNRAPTRLGPRLRLGRRAHSVSSRVASALPRSPCGIGVCAAIARALLHVRRASPGPRSSRTTLLLPEDCAYSPYWCRGDGLAFARHRRGDADHRGERAPAHFGDGLLAVLGEARDHLVDRAALQQVDEALVRLDALGRGPVVAPAHEQMATARCWSGTRRACPTSSPPHARPRRPAGIRHGPPSARPAFRRRALPPWDRCTAAARTCRSPSGSSAPRCLTAATPASFHASTSAAPNSGSPR